MEGRQDHHLRRAAVRLRSPLQAGLRHQHSRLERHARGYRARVIQQQVERGTWVPPEKKTSVKPTREERPDGHQPFGPFARKVVERKQRHGLAEGTLEDHAWRFGYLVDYFGRFELLDIDVAMVDDFRDEMVSAHRSSARRRSAASR